MDEPVRLACPECDVVYRLKRYRPGKRYKCKTCGNDLRPAEGHVLPPSADSVRIHNDPSTNHEGARALDFESGIADVNQVAVSAAQSLVPPPGRTAARRRPDGPAEAKNLEGQLARLRGLVDELDRRLSAAADDAGPEEAPALGEIAENGRKILSLARELDENAKAAREQLSQGMDRLEEKVAGVMERLASGVAPAGDAAASFPTLEVDIEALAAKLAANVRARAPRLDEESGSAVDALARVADELVREQSANTARLDGLAEEIRQSTQSVSRLEEWRGMLPVQVADEIGRTVEDRVVGPISGALARQAPAILSELQDSKLIDIVSRSVREAQRPLLREILAGGRGGVPIWLFASTLLPLLLILGYLFLPGDSAVADMAGAMTAVNDSLSRLEQHGVPPSPEAMERLGAIEDVVADIHGQALAHVKNAAALEEENKNLKSTLTERDALIKDYSETLQKQVRKLRAYEMRLTRLGVSPETIED